MKILARIIMITIKEKIIEIDKPSLVPPIIEINSALIKIIKMQTANNVSRLLDSLLKDYDNSLRPDFWGEFGHTEIH